MIRINYPILRKIQSTVVITRAHSEMEKKERRGIVRRKIVERSTRQPEIADKGLTERGAQLHSRRRMKSRRCIHSRVPN